MVNAQQLQGSWNRLRGQVKEKWATLSDDDLQINGANVDQIVGKIQQKTGETREAIEEFLNNLTAKSASVLSQAAEAGGEFAQNAGREIRDKYQDVAANVTERYEQLGEVVQHNPTRSVAAAFGIGLGVGILVGLALRSR